LEEFHYVELDFEIKLLEPLQNLVKHGNPFVVSPSNIDSPYNLLEYIRASKFSDIELMALVDNNVLTRATSIAKGEEITGDSESQNVARLACGIMCFFILGEFTVEPSMSIYEKASMSSHEEAASELFHFKVADHLHPQIFAELALGIRNSASQKEIEISRDVVIQNSRPLREKNFAKTLDPWKINYLFVLKAAELWKKGHGKVEAAKEFIEWMEKDTFFNAISSIFALLFLSPSRIAKMLKGINSSNIKKFRNGLKNCAWDLAYITQWSGFARDAKPETIWFLCTHDKVMKQIASTVFLQPGVSENDAIGGLFNSYWGEKDGRYLYNIYKDTVSSIALSKEKRDPRIHQRFHEVDDMIEKLEGVLGIKT